MDVKELQDYVRNHLELDEDDLPDSLLNPYLQDAFQRTIDFDGRWPRYEKAWDVALIAGQPAVSLPADIDPTQLLTVISQANGYRLVGITQENAEALYLQGNVTVMTGAPIYYSLFGTDANGLTQLYMWPTPDVTAGPYSLHLRGYRQPVWSEAASTIPDLDARLHFALAYYAMGLVYAAQEDEILEGVYMARWSRDLAQAAKRILAPAHHRPLVLNGGAPTGGVPSYIIIPPTPGIR